MNTEIPDHVTGPLREALALLKEHATGYMLFIDLGWQSDVGQAYCLKSHTVSQAHFIGIINEINSVAEEIKFGTSGNREHDQPEGAG